MKIYTKTGDKGTTRLVDGSCVEKHNPRVEAYGCLDELNSLLGFAASAIGEDPQFKNLKEDLKLTQSELFILGSLFACESEDVFKKLAQIEVQHIDRIEKSIDYLSEQLPELKNFILPGGSELSSRLHLCRTSCRRAERRSSEMAMADSRYEQCLVYLNRLSDYFFVAARFVNQQLNVEDPIWLSPLKKS